MPDVNPRPRQQVVAAAMFISAVVMLALSMMFYTGVIDLGDELGPIAAAVVGVAAILDLVVAMWFFQQGQSS